MERTEIILSDLAAAVLEKDRLSDTGSSDRWRVLPYETGAASGNLLIAAASAHPKPVTVAPELTGWYRIYVCMTGEGARVHLKLTDDEFARCVAVGNLRYYCSWDTMELAEEAFWKCADMTGQSITVEKLANNSSQSNVVWFRFVPMEEAEVNEFLNRQEHRTMLAHWDGDYPSIDAAKTPEEHCKALYAIKNSGVGVICQEGFTPETYPTQIAYAHRYGMKMFASHRVQLTGLCYPYVCGNPFVIEHPELRCRFRDGRICEFLSYGYKEVQDYIIDMMLKDAASGFDGVELIWIRGQHLLFEEPVVAHFREKFGDAVDCRRLPADDPRLMETRSDIMTGFCRRLRKALNDYAEEHGTEPLKIYATAYFELESSKKDSLDVERWASEGLIDGIVQCKMVVWEETDDVLAEDGLIDLEKYEEKAKTEYVYKRVFGNLMDRVAAGVPAYRAIADRYGVDFFTEIQWESNCPVEEYVEAAKQIYAAGGKAIALWDTYPSRAIHLAEWDAVSRLGDPACAAGMSEDTKAYHTIHRILSLGGKDMRYVHPNWVG